MYKKCIDASVWMMSKFSAHIDPWNFPIDFQVMLQLPVPAPTEKDIILNTLSHCTFANVTIQHNASLPEEEDIQNRMDFWTSDFTDFTVHEDNNLINEAILGQIEDANYRKWYRKTVESKRNAGSCMNTAQIAAELTKLTIRNMLYQYVVCTVFNR